MYLVQSYSKRPFRGRGNSTHSHKKNSYSEVINSGKSPNSSNEETKVMGVYEKGRGQVHPWQEGVPIGADLVTLCH